MAAANEPKIASVQRNACSRDRLRRLSPPAKNATTLAPRPPHLTAAVPSSQSTSGTPKKIATPTHLCSPIPNLTFWGGRKLGARPACELLVRRRAFPRPPSRL